MLLVLTPKQETSIASFFLPLSNNKFKNLKITLKIHYLVKDSSQYHRIYKVAFYFNFLLIFFRYQQLKQFLLFCYLNFNYYIGSDSLPRYSSIFCSALIFAMISFLVSSVNHCAIDFAIP